VIAGAFDELDSYHRGQYFDLDSAGRTNIERLSRYGQSFQDSKNEMENSLFADFAEKFRLSSQNWHLVRNGQICISSIGKRRLSDSIFLRILWTNSNINSSLCRVFFLKSSFGREEGRSRFGRGSSDFGSRQHS
jgi:hypothetical protein